MNTTSNGKFDRFDVGAEHADKTLTAAIKHEFPDKSWAQIKRLIASNRVEVSGNLCKDPARRIQIGEPVKIHRTPLPKPIDSNDIEILFADAHLVVLNKPARITSVREKRESGLSRKRRQLQPTVDELVPLAMKKYFDRKAGRDYSSKRQNQPPATQTVLPVHRLDRDTSGLMLMARTTAAKDALVSMFRHHRIDRRYLAVIKNMPDKTTFISWLVRDRGDRLRGSLAESDEPDDNSQRAVTHIRLLKSIGQYSLIECRLETGRTHQIRIHLSESGHPIAGEKMYVRPLGGKPYPTLAEAPRHVLHAHAIRFEHPITRQRMQFQCDWPADLKSWLTEIESTI